jgi:hypothetical protein
MSYHQLKKDCQSLTTQVDHIIHTLCNKQFEPKDPQTLHTLKSITNSKEIGEYFDLIDVLFILNYSVLVLKRVLDVILCRFLLEVELVMDRNTNKTSVLFYGLILKYMKHSGDESRMRKLVDLIVFDDWEYLDYEMALKDGIIDRELLKRRMDENKVAGACCTVEMVDGMNNTYSGIGYFGKASGEIVNVGEKIVCDDIYSENGLLNAALNQDSLEYEKCMYDSVDRLATRVFHVNSQLEDFENNRVAIKSSTLNSIYESVESLNERVSTINLMFKPQIAKRSDNDLHSGLEYYTDAIAPNLNEYMCDEINENSNNTPRVSEDKQKGSNNRLINLQRDTEKTYCLSENDDYLTRKIPRNSSVDTLPDIWNSLYGKKKNRSTNQFVDQNKSINEQNTENMHENYLNVLYYDGYNQGNYSNGESLCSLSNKTVEISKSSLNDPFVQTNLKHVKKDSILTKSYDSFKSQETLDSPVSSPNNLELVDSNPTMRDINGATLRDSKDDLNCGHVNSQIVSHNYINHPKGQTEGVPLKPPRLIVHKQPSLSDRLRAKILSIKSKRTKCAEELLGEVSFKLKDYSENEVCKSKSSSILHTPRRMLFNVNHSKNIPPKGKFKVNIRLFSYSPA